MGRKKSPNVKPFNIRKWTPRLIILIGCTFVSIILFVAVRTYYRTFLLFNQIEYGRDSYAVVTDLLNGGVDPNARGEDNKPAIISAVRWERIQIVRSLLEHGADPNITDNENSTPLMWAAYAGNLEMVELLHTHGADLNSRDKTGRTAMQYALDKKRTDVINYLRSTTK
jgi:ankyrin repeat protein